MPLQLLVVCLAINLDVADVLYSSNKLEISGPLEKALRWFKAM
jgi:hypothetical protein